MHACGSHCCGCSLGWRVHSAHECVNLAFCVVVFFVCPLRPYNNTPKYSTHTYNNVITGEATILQLQLCHLSIGGHRSCPHNTNNAQLESVRAVENNSVCACACVCACVPRARVCEWDLCSIRSAIAECVCISSGNSPKLCIRAQRAAIPRCLRATLPTSPQQRPHQQVRYGTRARVDQLSVW